MSYPAPILSLDFVNGGWHPALKFSRASDGTYWDSNGVLRTAGAGRRRLDCDPLTGICKGLLVSEGRTNLLTYSQDFTAWGNASATITSNVAVAPDGAATADKLVEAASSGEHYVYPAQPSLTSGTTYTGSFYAKAGERNKLRLQGTASTFGVYANINADFDLTDGIVLRTGASASAAIQSIGGGWYRCSLTLVATATTLGAIFPILLNGAANEYTGDGTSGLFIWGAQLEAGSVPTSYIPTTTAQVTRSADVCSLALADLVGPHGEPLWNGTEGTLLVRAKQDIASSSAAIFADISDGGTNNRIWMQGRNVSPGNDYSGSVLASGVVQSSSLMGAYSASVRSLAIAFKANDVATCLDGGTPVVDTVATIPSGLSQLTIGMNALGFSYLNGHIRQVLLFNRRLSNAQLQALTAA